jgi:hypothetical protein
MTDKAKGTTGTGSAPGQGKTHTATRVNPDTGVSESKDFTQAEWRARDKTEGWERLDGVEDDTTDDSGT